MKKTIYKCPECGEPGANVAIWGSAALTPCGLYFDGSMKDMTVDWKETFKCQSLDGCTFEGDSSDFKHEVDEAKNA
jgi:hypothetical protein